MPAKVLVTGGAGYVGAHCARALAAAGYEVVTLDDLSHGHRAAATGTLVEADLRDRARLVDVLGRGFDAVLHFAARMSVAESVADPLGYYDVNVGGTMVLLDAMRTAGCDKIVFSSTCAVYGAPPCVPIAEDTPFAPISPYGETKAVVERALALARDQGQLHSISLRYFNAAGAARDGALGEAHDPETHLIPLALQGVLHDRVLKVFGTDYPTPDGTCIRDYIHVEDLAAAHLAALERLLAGEPGGAWNVGTGTGASVREVLDMVTHITGRAPRVIESPSRPGDPPTLVADTTRVARDFGWQARYGLEDIIADAWRWHQAPRYGA